MKRPISRPSLAHCALLGVCLATCGPAVLPAQQNFEEKLLEAEEDDSEQSQLLEQISALRDQPLDLNRASKQKLEMIPNLASNVLDAILQFRKEKGKFRSVRQLEELPEINSSLFEYLRTVLVVAPKRLDAKRRVRASWRSRASGRRDEPTGYQDGSYASGSEKIYNRGKFNLADRVSAGILLEKDAGEKRLDDLALFFVRAKLTQGAELLIGDFQMQVGQGLVLWGPYGFSKGSNPVHPVRKRARGMRGYLSVDENAALHGIAARIAVGRLGLHLFTSKSSIDATPLSEEDIRSLGTSGFHRNANELAMKDVVEETIVGGRIEAGPFRRLRLGATAYGSTYSKRLADPDFERNHFKLRGDRNHVAGFDWRYEHAGMGFFGEAARSRSGGIALISGATLELQRIRLAILVRDYQRDFQNLHGFAFGEQGGATQNERGAYLGLQFHASKTTTVNAYYDVYAFPWRTYLQPLPLHGNDFMALLEQKFNRDLMLGLRVRQKSREEVQDFPADQAVGVEELVVRTQRQIRLQFDYRLSKEIRVRGRVEATRITYTGFGRDLDDQSETGFLLYQDLRFNPSPKIALAARLTFFDTKSFDSRVYQYENDLPGLVTNRALFDQGTRWYVLLKYHPVKSVALYAKYSELFKEGETTIGSGRDAIIGNLDRRFSAQLDLQLR